jgi:hypothetical protein
MYREIANYDRRFQVWKYTVGHSQLLLRSTKSPDHATRVDVLFKGVAEFRLPTSFDGLSIREIPKDDRQETANLHLLTSLSPDTRVFVIQGNDFSGYVAALAALHHEDEGEYYAPSFFARHNII